MFVADATERHLINTVLLSETILSCNSFELLPNLVPFLFVFIPDIFLDESLLILNNHVNWIVH
jgi:hypothetical protein